MPLVRNHLTFPVPSSASPEPSLVTSNPAITTPATTPEATSISLPERKSSKAWIAAAVMVPLVGLAGLGFLFFLFVRYKRKKQEAQARGAGGPPPAIPAPYTNQPDPNLPPQYYAPQMQQGAGGPGMVPFGVAKHDSWAPPQSPNTQGSISPNPHNSVYGAPDQQQWQSPNTQNTSVPIGGKPVYGGPSPSLSPQSAHAYPAPSVGENGVYAHTTETGRPFSTELEGGTVQQQPHYGNMRPHNH